VSPLPQTAYPELARAVGGRRWGDVRQVLRRTALLGGGYSLLAGVFLLIAGPALIRRLYTPEFLPAYPALLILLVGFLVANIFLWRRQLLLVLGLPEFATKLNLVLAGLKVAGIFLLTPRGGYLANAGLLAGFYIAASAVGAWKGLTTLKTREAQT
jgi:O-antigen/teichoic acid export membrane protein